MQERRSSVSRQACHAVGVLAAACGRSFEPLALHLLPVVFKTLAMGINVCVVGDWVVRQAGRRGELPNFRPLVAATLHC